MYLEKGYTMWEFGFNTQHNWEDLYDHVKKKIWYSCYLFFHTSSKNHKENGYMPGLDLLTIFL